MPAKLQPMRRKIMRRYRGLCGYCGQHIGSAGTLDHYMPRALGGGSEASNLVWACIKCQQLKGHLHPADWELIKPQASNISTGRIALLQLIAAKTRASR